MSMAYRQQWNKNAKSWCIKRFELLSCALFLWTHTHTIWSPVNVILSLTCTRVWDMNITRNSYTKWKQVSKQLRILKKLKPDLHKQNRIAKNFQSPLQDRWKEYRTLQLEIQVKVALPQISPLQNPDSEHSTVTLRFLS